MVTSRCLERGLKPTACPQTHGAEMAGCGSTSVYGRMLYIRAQPIISLYPASSELISEVQTNPRLQASRDHQRLYIPPTVVVSVSSAQEFAANQHPQPLNVSPPPSAELEPLELRGLELISPGKSPRAKLSSDPVSSQR
ncbi:hypothetical protein RUND412_001811 [Rhizina undulata]